MKLFDRLNEWMAAIAAITLGLVTVSVVFEVVMRYAFGKPTTWVIDLSEYALVFCLFFSTAWVLARDAHIKIDIILLMCPPKVVRALTLLASVVGAFSSAVFCIAAVLVVWEAYRDAEVIWRSIIAPKWLVMGAIPLGSFFLTVQFVRRAWTNAQEL